MREIFTVPRIPLNEQGLCAHATIISAARSFHINHIHQHDLHVHVSDPGWGTEPSELTEMARDLLPDDHILAKEHWQADEVSKLLNESRVVLILDVTDCLERVNKVTGEKVDKVDGHYIILYKLIEIKGSLFALVIDPSKNEIVVEGNYGVINTNQENVYLIPFDILDLIWVDDKKDGSINDHWALALLHPKDDASILDQFRK